MCVNEDECLGVWDRRESVWVCVEEEMCVKVCVSEVICI